MRGDQDHPALLLWTRGTTFPVWENILFSMSILWEVCSSALALTSTTFGSLCQASSLLDNLRESCWRHPERNWFVSPHHLTSKCLEGALLWSPSTNWKHWLCFRKKKISRTEEGISLVAKVACPGAGKSTGGVRASKGWRKECACLIKFLSHTELKLGFGYLSMGNSVVYSSWLHFLWFLYAMWSLYIL